MAEKMKEDKKQKNEVSEVKGGANETKSKIVETKDKGKKKKSFLTQDFSFSNKVSALDVVLSIKHLSIMLRSSMPLSDALQVLTVQSESPKLQEIYGEIYLDVQKGVPMAESMKKHPNAFSHIMISVISVGEQGGTLEKNLLFLAEFLKKNYELSRKVKGALTYPMIIFALTAFEMLGVVFFIIPKLDALFSSFDNVPPFTQLVISVTGFIRGNWPALLIGGIVFYIVSKVFLGTSIGKKFKDHVSLRFPIVKNLTKKHILTNFSRTLGILLESSIPISEALRIASDTIENHVYRNAVFKLYEDVSAGNNLADALKKHPKLFPPTFTKMIEVGEDTGSLEENLLYLHEFYAEEVTEMSNNLATLIEPILLVFIGLMIGLLAITIVGPIYQLTGSINAN